MIWQIIKGEKGCDVDGASSIKLSYTLSKHDPNENQMI